jgi:hypothetical protein
MKRSSGSAAGPRRRAGQVRRRRARQGGRGGTTRHRPRSARHPDPAWVPLFQGRSCSSTSARSCSRTPAGASPSASRVTTPGSPPALQVSWSTITLTSCTHSAAAWWCRAAARRRPTPRWSASSPRSSERWRAVDRPGDEFAARGCPPDPPRRSPGPCAKRAAEAPAAQALGPSAAVGARRAAGVVCWRAGRAATPHKCGASRMMWVREREQYRRERPWR